MRSLKSRRQQGPAPSKTSKGGCFPASPQLLGVVGYSRHPRLAGVKLPSLPLSSQDALPVSVSPSQTKISALLPHLFLSWLSGPKPTVISKVCLYLFIQWKRTRIFWLSNCLLTAMAFTHLNGRTACLCGHEKVHAACLEDS